MFQQLMVQVPIARHGVHRQAFFGGGLKAQEGEARRQLVQDEQRAVDVRHRPVLLPARVSHSAIKAACLTDYKLAMKGPHSSGHSVHSAGLRTCTAGAAAGLAGCKHHK